MNKIDAMYSIVTLRVLPILFGLPLFPDCIFLRFRLT